MHRDSTLHHQRRRAAPAVRIVLADAHAVFRDALCRLLFYEPRIKVVAHTSIAEELVYLLQICEPDILLLDLTTLQLLSPPDLHVLSRQRSDLRIILLHTCDNQLNCRRVLQLRPCALLDKRSLPEALLSTIRGAFSGPRLSFRFAPGLVGERP